MLSLSFLLESNSKYFINIVDIVKGYVSTAFQLHQFNNLSKYEFFLFLISLFVLFFTLSFHLEDEGKNKILEMTIGNSFFMITFSQIDVFLDSEEINSSWNSAGGDGPWQYVEAFTILCLSLWDETLGKHLRRQF